MVATALALAMNLFGVSVANEGMNSAYADAGAATLADRVLEHWNRSLGHQDTSDLEPSALWRHRWIMQTRENRRKRWTYARRVLTMVGEEEFGAAQLPRMMSPLYKAMRFWNVFRKARPKNPARRAASAQGKN